MIQRIQSVYLFISIVLIVVSGFVGNIFNVITNSNNTTYGYQANEVYVIGTKTLISSEPQYLWFYPIVIALVGLYALFSFKDLKKQLKLARIYWGAVIATLLIHVGMKYYTQFQVEEGQLIQASAGASFYLTVIAMPFAHLAFMNILKDKRTIASIDRIR